MFFYAGPSWKERTRSQATVSVPRRGFVVFLLLTSICAVWPSTSRFSPPKGIRCFSTEEGINGKRENLEVSVPRRGFVVFLPPQTRLAEDPELHRFSPPKGIRCFSTTKAELKALRAKRKVSVPRRGFVVFLPVYNIRNVQTGTVWVSVPRRGFVVFLLRNQHQRSRRPHPVSVPRRGFVVFLPDVAVQPHSDELRFSPPKGIRCFSTTLSTAPKSRRGDCRFSPPKGIRCFSTPKGKGGDHAKPDGFSPPKGIRCFSTGGLFDLMEIAEDEIAKFQSPEGDSLFFYPNSNLTNALQSTWFQSPEGDSLFFYDPSLPQALSHWISPVSVPRRGFVVFLRGRSAILNSGQKMVSVPRRGFVVFLLLSPVSNRAQVPLSYHFDLTTDTEVEITSGQIGRKSHLATTLTLVCTMQTPPFCTVVPPTPHFFEIRLSMGAMGRGRTMLWSHPRPTFSKSEHRRIPQKPGGRSVFSRHFLYICPCLQTSSTTCSG